MLDGVFKKDACDMHGRYSVCKRYLSRLDVGEVPLEAEANGCDLTLAPPGILMLTPLEEMLIASIPVLVSMYRIIGRGVPALRSLESRGNSFSFCNDLGVVAHVLPMLP